MSAENMDREFNVDNLDTTEFWKSLDVSTQLTLNEQLRNHTFSVKFYNIHFIDYCELLAMAHVLNSYHY